MNLYEIIALFTQNRQFLPAAIFAGARKLDVNFCTVKRFYCVSPSLATLQPVHQSLTPRLQVQVFLINLCTNALSKLCKCPPARHLHGLRLVHKLINAPVHLFDLWLVHKTPSLLRERERGGICAANAARLETIFLWKDTSKK